MSSTLRILRLGHAGDGVTGDGRFVPFTAPGDVVRLDDEGRLLDIVTPSPQRAPPPCRLFTRCGGCALQHLDGEAYRAFKREQVAQALAQRGFADAVVEEPVSVAPRSRRRAALKAEKRGGDIVLGFHARQSHALVDLSECHVLTPGLFALTRKLRPLLASLLKEGEGAELHLTEMENGFDLALTMKRALPPAFVAQIAAQAPALGLLRVMAGDMPVVRFAPPRLTLGGAGVLPPPRAFLQATRQSEEFLQQKVAAAAGKAKRIADLFCGIGTFALPLARQARVEAFDGAEAMVAALAMAARGTQGLKPLTATRRDLFRHPLTARELAPFEAIVLDPPRAGAAAQVAEIAQIKRGRVVYVSCNPASFARDARVLADGGFRLGPVTPLDQFLWSAELELVAAFEK